jgi:hypothetical protein
MSISRDRSRNRSGLTYLRTRYVARSKYLLHSRDAEFLGVFQDIRAQWTQRYERWGIVAAPAPEGLDLDLDYRKQGMLWPDHFWRAREHFYTLESSRLYSREDALLIPQSQRDRESAVLEVCRHFWPERYFPNPFVRASSHAAAPLASIDRSSRYR